MSVSDAFHCLAVDYTVSPDPASDCVFLYDLPCVYCVALCFVLLTSSFLFVLHFVVPCFSVFVYTAGMIIGFRIDLY